MLAATRKKRLKLRQKQKQKPVRSSQHLIEIDAAISTFDSAYVAPARVRIWNLSTGRLRFRSAIPFREDALLLMVMKDSDLPHVPTIVRVLQCRSRDSAYEIFARFERMGSFFREILQKRLVRPKKTPRRRTYTLQ